MSGDLENLGQGTPDDQRYFVTVADERTILHFGSIRTAGMPCSARSPTACARPPTTAGRRARSSPSSTVVRADQHVLLGEERARRPAVVGGLAQAVGDLAEQGIPTIRDEPKWRVVPLVGDGHEVALVVGRSLAEVLQVAAHVDGANELVRVIEVLQEFGADARHAGCGLSDGSRVSGDLHPGGPGARIPGSAGVGDDVKRLARRSAPRGRQGAGETSWRPAAGVVVDGLAPRGCSWPR